MLQVSQQLQSPEVEPYSKITLINLLHSFFLVYIEVGLQNISVTKRGGVIVDHQPHLQSEVGICCRSECFNGCFGHSLAFCGPSRADAVTYE